MRRSFNQWMEETGTPAPTEEPIIPTDEQEVLGWDEEPDPQ